LAATLATILLLAIPMEAQMPILLLQMAAYFIQPVLPAQFWQARFFERLVGEFSHVCFPFRDFFNDSRDGPERATRYKASERAEALYRSKIYQRKATCDDYRLPVEFPKLAQSPEHPTLCRPLDSAGVDDDDVRF
jgi:hypothetical protein